MEINVEDTAHITLGFGGSDRMRPATGQLNLDFVRHDYTRRVSALWKSGTLQWDGVSGRVEQWRAGDSDWEVLHEDAPEAPSTSTLQWESFLRALEAGSGVGASMLETLGSTW